VPTAVRASVAGHDRWRAGLGSFEQSQDDPPEQVFDAASAFGGVGDAKIVMLASRNVARLIQRREAARTSLPRWLRQLAR
jgi:hypothetical protein